MSGNIVEFALPVAISYPLALANGPDGALWFTEGAVRNQIGRITLSGTVSEYAVQQPARTAGVGNENAAVAPPYPGWLAAGPDGAIWFTEAAGAVVRFTIPPAASKARKPL